jgi:hypothetical protein
MKNTQKGGVSYGHGHHLLCIIEARRERKQPRNISTVDLIITDNNNTKSKKNKTKSSHQYSRTAILHQCERRARAMCQNIFSTADPLKILPKRKKGPAQYNRDPALLLMGWSLVCILIAASHKREQQRNM